MDNHNSTTVGTGDSSEGFPPNANRDTTEHSRSDSGATEGRGSFPANASSIAPPGQTPGPRTEQEQKPPISDLKLASNRRNAKRSTGPKTPEGKENSKRNSYKIGIFAQQLFSSTTEGINEQAKYAGTAKRIFDHYQPEGVMEELLVDRVVTETVRFAHLLWYERQELGRTKPFGEQALDRVVRYQAAINRQLTKAIEQLDELQAQRKAASGASEPSYGSEPDSEADEPCDLPDEPAPGYEEQLTSAASEDSPYDRHVPTESSDVLGKHQYASAPGEASSRNEEVSNSGPQQTEKYKTNPPSTSSDGVKDGTAHEEPEQTPSPAAIAERAASPAAPQEPNNRLVPTSDSGIKSQNAVPREPSQQDIFDCL